LFVPRLCRCLTRSFFVFPNKFSIFFLLVLSQFLSDIVQTFHNARSFHPLKFCHNRFSFSRPRLSWQRPLIFHMSFFSSTYLVRPDGPPRPLREEEEEEERDEEESPAVTALISLFLLTNCDNAATGKDVVTKHDLLHTVNKLFCQCKLTITITDECVSVGYCPTVPLLVGVCYYVLIIRLFSMHCVRVVQQKCYFYCGRLQLMHSLLVFHYV